MRHRLYGKQLGRNHHERQILLKNLLLSFLTYGKIKSTPAKITSVRPLVTKSIRHILTKPRLTSSRFLGRFINSRSTIKTILDQFTASYTDGVRPQLAIVKVHRRVGDNAIISELSLNPALKPLPKVEVVKEKKSAPAKEVKKVVKKAPKAKGKL
ncbi:MAG: L17 family ribosomal protein [Candidatus Shapirobacteria bacterium]